MSYVSICYIAIFLFTMMKIIFGAVSFLAKKGSQTPDRKIHNYMLVNASSALALTGIYIDNPDSFIAHISGAVGVPSFEGFVGLSLFYMLMSLLLCRGSKGE